MRSLLSSFVVLLGALLTGCSSTGPMPDAATTQAVAAEYRIGPGDTLNVFVFGHPELTTTVPVRPDGRVSTPLVDDLVAAGKPASQLARDIEQRLSEFLRAPKVNVIVTGFVGGDQVRVVGQAARARAVPFRANMTALDVMIEVGGLAEFAAGNRAKIVRVLDGKSVEIRVRLDDLLKKGDIRANVPMMPGDVIIIPESRF